MTDNKDLKYTQQFKEPNIPKTYEQFVLEEQSEQDQKIADSYAAEFGSYGDIGVQKGYGPCLAYNPSCRCSLEELQRQKLILENWEIEQRINITRAETNQQEENQLRTERDNLREQLNAINADCHNLRQQLTNERTNHQQTRNDLSAAQNLINNTQTVLRTTTPQEQNLQSSTDRQNVINNTQNGLRTDTYNSVRPIDLCEFF